MGTFVLVIDDSPTICKTVEVMLGRVGYEVRCFPDGPSAIEWLQSQAVMPDLFLVDLELPKMDGYSLISYLHARTVFANTPFIIISKCHGLVGRLKGRLVGAKDYIVKPFKTAELVPLIEKYLGVPAKVVSFD